MKMPVNSILRRRAPRRTGMSPLLGGMNTANTDISPMGVQNQLFQNQPIQNQPMNTVNTSIPSLGTQPRPISPPGMEPLFGVGGPISPPGMPPIQGGFNPAEFSKMLNPEQKKDFMSLGRNIGGNYMGWGKNAAKGSGLTLSPEEMLRKRYGVGPSNNMFG